MAQSASYVGTAQRRVDGSAKVTGAARYAGEFAAPDLVHGVIVCSTIAKGLIKSIDISAAQAVPGVIEVITHQNRPRTPWFDSPHRDQVAPPGSPFRPLRDDKIVYSGQPIALVLAGDLGTARHAASLVRCEYVAEAHATKLDLERSRAYEPPKKRFGPLPEPRGDAPAAFKDAPVKIQNEYRIPIEHHNPMEPHAATVVLEADGRLVVHDKTQGVKNSHQFVVKVFGLPSDRVRVISPFVGGAFGSGLRPQYQLFLAEMAALVLERSVRVVLTREQMFTVGYRPDTLQTVALGANTDGTLRAVVHDAVAGTSQYEDYQENTVNWSGLLYRCDNVRLRYWLAKTDTPTPLDMRAPGGSTGVFALETAMDELAYACGLDPIELRLRNYAEEDQNTKKPISSKALRACYQQGADRFGWSKRDPAPRSMRDGRELVGWGMAGGVWEAMMFPTSARAVLNLDGKLTVECATADIGTGTFTILTQIGADALGLPMTEVTANIADSTLPNAFVEGGSATAASAGCAVQAACDGLRKELFDHAQALAESPLAGATLDDVIFADGGVVLASDPARGVTFTAILQAGGVDRVEAEAKVGPGMTATASSHENYAHSAVFAEVKIDEALGVIRVTRLVNAVAAGRILNPSTARSQILGGMVFGLGQALTEETMVDHNLGRFMNRNLAEYHVPVHADIYDAEIIFVEEHDTSNPLGVKGVGEIGVVGTAAAIGNAVYHATGVRVRELPITLDKILVNGL